MYKSEMERQLPSKKCPICGKTFIVMYLRNWAYKIDKKVYCSYKCYRKGGGDNGKENHYVRCKPVNKSRTSKTM